MEIAPDFWKDISYDDWIKERLNRGINLNRIYDEFCKCLPWLNDLIIIRLEIKQYTEYADQVSYFMFYAVL